MQRACWGLAVVLMLVLGSGCGILTQPVEPTGATTPADVAASFLATVNTALEDPTLDQFDTRRRYAEQLAAHFAPSERVRYRQSLQEMLALFAAGKAELPAGQELTLTLEYDDLEVQQLSETEARVRLIGGSLRYRIVEIAPNGFREVLLDQQHTLTDVMGLENSTLPILRVEEQWYLTALDATP